MNFREEFNLAVRARCAVMYVTTREEERLLSVVRDCAAELEKHADRQLGFCLRL